MPLFKCSKCGCVENTALSNYWTQYLIDKTKALCSDCDPEIGKWHGRFPQKSAAAAGYKLASDGFLYHADDVATEWFRWRMRHQGLKVLGDA